MTSSEEPLRGASAADEPDNSFDDDARESGNRDDEPTSAAARLALKHSHIAQSKDPSSEPQGSEPQGEAEAKTPLQPAGDRPDTETTDRRARLNLRAERSDAESGAANQTADATAKSLLSKAAAGAAALSAGDLLEPAAETPNWQVAPSAVDYEDPLVTCLSLLAGLLQRPISAEALKAGLPHAEESFTPELAIRAAERAGISAAIMHRPKVKNILPVTLPCILLLKGSNCCIMMGYASKTEVSIVLPEGGGTKKTVSLDELQQQYTGYAVYARPEFKFDDRAPEIRLKDPRTWFWGTLAQFWPIYSHVLLASILINCFAIASPLFIMNVYDRVVPNNAIETLWVLALGVAIVFVFEFVMRNLRTYFVDVAGKNADVIIASRLLEHLMATRLDSRPPSTGAMANNLREFESLREFFTSGTVVTLVDLPFIFLFLGVIWLVAGPIAFVPLAAVPLVILIGTVLQFPLRSVIEKTQRESNQKHALLVETIDGLETIKASAAEGKVQRSWERFVGLTAESSGKARFLSGLATTFAQVSIQMSTVAVVVFGVYMIAEGDITMGALIAATILTGRALAPLGAIAGMLTRLQQSRVALKSLDELMKKPVERTEGKTFLHRPRLSGEVEYKDVKFSYPGQETIALDSISFKIKPGERVGILGRIGSGKSTMARMTIGLYEPAEGSVLMDGTDIRQIDPADLRRNVGYVAQDNYLFFGSVKENISFGAPHVDDETILRAAAIAGVTDFLRTHPHGFDLQVGERGMGLSGGQRQAVVIARSLLLDPPIILLDEPTSHMDNSSEAAFKQRLQQVLPGKTLILVTHRSSLLSLVDRLIIMDNGRIAADGPKDEVLNALKQGQVRAVKR